MALSVEAITGIISLFLALPPLIFGLYKLTLHRRKATVLPRYESHWPRTPTFVDRMFHIGLDGNID